MMHATIAGHLGADVETRYTEKGKKVSTIRVAANTRRAGKDETIWWNVSLWGDTFDGLLPFLKKGTGVIVEGDFLRDMYNDRDGKLQVSLGISAKSVILNPFGRSDRSSQEGAGASQQSTAAPYASNASSAPSHQNREEYAPASSYGAGSGAPASNQSAAGSGAPSYSDYASKEDVPF